MIARDDRLDRLRRPRRQIRRALREFLAARLPDHLVPAAHRGAATELPLNANGKLDRARTARTRGRPSTTADARTPAEQALCELFADVLGLPRVGPDDGFFALGGHSLLATRLVSRIRGVLGVEVPIRAVFDAPTPARLAELLDPDRDARPALRRQDRPDVLPLSFAQQRLWFLDRLDGPERDLQHPVGVAAVRPGRRRTRCGPRSATWCTRHEVLRTLIVDSDGTPRQVVLDAVSPRAGGGVRRGGAARERGWPRRELLLRHRRGDPGPGRTAEHRSRDGTCSCCWCTTSRRTAGHCRR